MNSNATLQSAALQHGLPGPRFSEDESRPPPPRRPPTERRTKERNMHTLATQPTTQPLPTPRQVVQRTRGVSHGPITRLMSPSDLGEVVKPFVFLDLFDVDLHDPRAGFSVHPHSGIATVTVLTRGDLRFEDAADGTGHIDFGGVEWMRAGGGVWHGKELSGGRSPRARGFQLWLALPPELENGTVDSQYLESSRIPSVGAARVILGHHEGAASPVRAPAGLTYLLVRLPAGQRWTFQAPQGQTTAWLAVAEGELTGEVPASAGEMLAFAEGPAPLHLQAGPNAEAVFVVGAAVPHAHDLHLGYYSVHTSQAALDEGEANIERLRRRLVEAGDRRTASGNIPVFK
jgi:redox-sensitive bicupin YhaK (pirin superfamily)